MKKLFVFQPKIIKIYKTDLDTIAHTMQLFINKKYTCEQLRYENLITAIQLFFTVVKEELTNERIEECEKYNFDIYFDTLLNHLAFLEVIPEGMYLIEV